MTISLPPSHSWYLISFVFPFTAHAPYKTLESHSTPITALDFSEPYGTLVSSSQDDPQPRVWDLMTGSEIGRLHGHRSGVKCIQVEDNLCLTGSEDGSARLWDLRLVDDDWEKDGLSDVLEEDSSSYHDGELVEKPDCTTSATVSEAGTDSEGPCLRTFVGHSKAVTALYFEDECLVNAPSVSMCATMLTLNRSRVRPTRLSVSGISPLANVFSQWTSFGRSPIPT